MLIFFRNSAKPPKEVFDKEYYIEDISAEGMYKVPLFCCHTKCFILQSALNSFFGYFFHLFKFFTSIIILNKITAETYYA